MAEGRITSWDEARGFGWFKTLDEYSAGGVFVHISKMPRRAAPLHGDEFSFDIERDSRGRKYARNVRLISAAVTEARRVCG